MYPNLRREKHLWRKGYNRIACLDESGRGSLAGPVVASAVIIKKSKVRAAYPTTLPPKGRAPHQKSKVLFKEIKDSKKLTAKKREKLYKILTNHPQIEWGMGRVSEKVIDRINILEATKLAMKKAVRKLKRKPDFLILDGISKINTKIPQKLIKSADEKVFSCSCASVLAKVCRDRIMERYHKKYPKYGFDKHKGYPTRLHLARLRKYGPCKIHRKSFWPVIKSQK